MVIVLIGAGRIGSAIADAADAAGHTVHALRSDSDPAFLRSTDVDLLVLAAAPEDQDKYDGFDEFQRSLDWMPSLLSEAVPLASVSFLSPDRLRRLAGSRPAVRFMCSSAVTERESLRFFDRAGNERAIERLKAALPGPWRSVAPDDFERYTRLLIVSALHCALLDRIERTVDLEAEEQSFLTETLAEARRMIRAHDGEVGDALDSARTPGGITRSLLTDSAFEPIARRLFGHADDSGTRP